MKLPANKKLKTDKSGKTRIVDTVNPKLDHSAKIRQRTSKKQRVVRKGTP